MCRLISAAVRASTSSRSSEAFTSSPISVRVASTSAETSGAGAGATVVCSSRVMRQAHYNRSALTGRAVRNRLCFVLYRAESQPAHVGEIPVALGIVQPVSHHEFVGNGEANIIRPDLSDAPLRFVQQHSHTNTPGLALFENAQEILQRHACVQDIFDDDDCLSLDAGVQIARQLYFAGSMCVVSIARDGDEIERNFSAHLPR